MKKREEIGDCPKCESDIGWDIEYNIFKTSLIRDVEWLKYTCCNCGYGEDVHTADKVEAA